MSKGPVPSEEIVVCEYCDAVARRVALRRGERALCPCCCSPLYRRRRLGLDGTLAVTVTALVALVIANIYPVMTMNLQGMHSSATLWQAVLAIDGQGFVAVAAVVAVAGLIAPLAQLLLLLYVCVPLRLGGRAPGAVYALHALRRVRPWSMVEVLLLGALVATVKLAAMASVSPGVGLFGFAALTVCVAILVAEDGLQLWEWSVPCPR